MPPKLIKESSQEAEQVEERQTQVLMLVENFRTTHRNVGKLRDWLDSQPNLTLEVLQDRREYFRTQVEKAQDLSAKLNVLADSNQKLTIDYFTKQFATKFETLSGHVEHDLLTRFNALTLERNQQTLQAAPPTRQAAGQNNANGASIRLPKLDLPTFDGSFDQWQQFYDLFQATVGDQPNLSNAAKMQYLKAAVRGPAANFLSALPISDSNYEIAWTRIKERYQNKRAQVSHHLHKITSMQPVGQDALSKLQSLTDTLNLAVDSLKLLHPAAEHWDAMLIHIAVQKLGIGLQKEWEKTLIGIDDYPTLGAFNSFLQSQIRIQENLERNKGTGSSQETHRFQKAAHNTAVDRSAGSCSYCAQPQKIYKCEEFQALTLAERYNVQREKELCANCLHKGHTRQECQSQVTCRHCSGRHHTLLHYDKAPKQLSKAEKKKSEKSPSPKRKAKSNHLVNTESADESSDEGSTSEEFIEEEEEKEEYFGGHSWQTHKDVLLATALVRVHSPLGKTAVARALIDTGAETSFISEALAQTMRLPKKKVQVTVTGLQGTKTGAIRHATSLQFSAVQDGSRRFDLQAYVLQHITNYKPKRFSPERYEELQHLILADPQPASKLKIDILLGSDVLGQIMKGGFLKLQGSKVTAQATHLGWILSGPVREVTVSHAITVSHAACETDALLKKFWEIEDFPEKKLLSEEDEMCEKYFSTTTTRDAQGRYCVRLPFKSETAEDELGESKSIAIASWARVARGLQKTPKLRQEYDEFISEYEKLGHMREMKPDDPELSSCVFLTHHPIIRPDHLTTQLRVVYNASRATKSGVSLNDVLCAGPKLQNDVADVVTDWRRHQFVLKADISKMFRQILIHEDDQK